MGTTAIVLLITGILAALGSAAVGISNGVQNTKAQKEANETNIKLAREANAANAEQAQIAWKHSLPLEQVNNLMSAGMSRQGALSALTGGGSYSAPVMQSGRVEPVTKDYSQVSSALERLGTIPASVQQAESIDAQRYALEVDTLNKINADKRAQEQHEFDMWQKLYGKDATLKLDNLSSKIVQQANEKGINIDDIDTIDKLINSFDLSKDKDFVSLPKYARDELFNSVRSQAAENREKQRMQIDIDKNKREEADAKDRHLLALDTLKNSEFGRSLTHAQINKLEKDANHVQRMIDEYDDSNDARQKEYAARSAEADFKRIMAIFGISEHEFKNSNFWEYDENGNIRPSGIGMQRQGIRDAWKFVGDFFGVGMLQDLLRGLVVIGK